MHGAVQESETSLKIIYDNAVQKYSDTYEEVLWAVADDNLLRRQMTDIFDKSYERIMDERIGRTKLSKKTFYQRIYSLTTPRHGEVLIPRGNGWYEFRENIVRGYVRLRAAKEGLALGREGFA